MRGARVYGAQWPPQLPPASFLSVEKGEHQNAKGEDLYETTEFAIVTDSGEMRSSCSALLFPFTSPTTR